MLAVGGLPVFNVVVNNVLLAAVGASFIQITDKLIIHSLYDY